VPRGLGLTPWRDAGKAYLVSGGDVLLGTCVLAWGALDPQWEGYGCRSGRVPLAHGAIAHQPESTRKIDTIADSTRPDSTQSKSRTIPIAHQPDSARIHFGTFHAKRGDGAGAGGGAEGPPCNPPPCVCVCV